MAPTPGIPLLHRARRGLGRFERSAWFRPVVVVLTVCLFGLAMGVITRQQRAELESQIVGRDADLLQAVARLHLQMALAESGTNRVEETTLFNAVLKTSSLAGVIGARLFTADGEFSTSFPINVAEARLAPADLESLRAGRPIARFRPDAPLEDLFFDAAADPAQSGRRIPMLDVAIPLIAGPGGGSPPAGYALFTIEGHTVEGEFRRLRQGLLRRAAMVFGVAAAAIGLALMWAFGRLQAVNRTLLERTSRLQRANQELALSAKTSALGSVAAHLVHGMKNPLFGLQAIASERSREETEDRGEDWRVVSAAAERLQTLITETVSILGEEESTDRYEVPLGEILDQFRRKFDAPARASGILLEVDGTLAGRTDNRTASLLGLILANLAQNALQATARGMRVALQVVVDGEGVDFRVSDQGTGIPEGLRGSLFVPCRSTKPGGSGIGLAISRQLALHLGAELRLVQTGPTGSVFSLRLPLECLRLESAPPAAGPRRIIPLGMVAAGLGALGLLAGAAPLSAQSPRWRWANPTPHGNHVYDMVSNLGVTVQVGDRGQAHASADLAAWEPLDTGTTNALLATVFQGDRLFITGERGTVLFADSLDEIQAGRLDIATDDWLEGVASSGSRLIAAGDNAALYISDDSGTNWTRKTVQFSNWLTGITYGSTKGFLVVGEDGFAAISSNGNSWNPQKTGVTNTFFRARFLNNTYFAVGTRGALLSSPDGQKWTVLPTGVTNSLFDIAWNGSSYLLVGDGEVLVASAPTAWTNTRGVGRPVPPPRWTYYAATWEGAEYLLAGRTGMIVHGYSTNGVAGDLNLAWETHSDPVRNWLWDVTRVSGRYVVVGDLGTLMTSGDGFAWSLELPPNVATNVLMLGVGGDTNTLVAVGSRGTALYSTRSFTNVVSTNQVIVGINTTNTVVSTNLVNTLGIFWAAAAASGTTNDLAAAVRFRGGSLVAVGGHGAVVRSDDEGRTWTPLPRPADVFLSGLAVFHDTLVAVGDRGTILTSTNATNWVAHPSGTTNWIFRVRALEETLVAVGEGGVVLSSPDALAWRAESSGTTRWLNDVTSVAEPVPAWYAVGVQGTVLVKTNGGGWAPADSITQRSLYGISHNETGQLVTVGIEGAILRTQLTLPQDPISFLSFDSQTNRLTFLMTGVTGQRFALDRTDDVSSPTNWILGPTLEFLDPSGTLLYVEDQGTNIPPAREFRARQVH